MKLYRYCLIVAASTFVCSLPLAAEIYKTVDAQGRVTYTDKPPPKDQKREQLELKHINTQPPVEPQPRQRGQSREDDEDETNYSVSLTSPADGTQVPPGQRDLTLSAQVNPGLRGGYQVQFLMNGEPVGQPSNSTSWTIEEVYRGEHTVSARVLNDDGDVVATSDSVTVYVHRPTLNSPARR